ncbi:Integrator complex subunit 5 [Orchesella cincta]|uniref:Integrator complex subunit 5 n=1 Tax=Orchesella cincta TaxID=48709 RepID=A0A1D2MFY6_ORCCI|nr:Integrator complex subunit 5 [Orchesella cincta]
MHDHFTAEITNLLYESDSGRKDLFKNFPCISSLKENHSILMQFLTDMDPQVCRTAKQFVKLLALYDGPAIGVTASCHYLHFATEDKHLWHLTDLLAALELKYSTVLQDSLRILAVKSELSSTQSKYHGSYSEDPLRIWKNILRLVKTEGLQSHAPIRYKLSTVLQENLMVLTPNLDIRRTTFSMQEASVVVEIISKLPNLSKKAKFGDLLTLERFLVDYLFKVLLSVNSTTKKAAEVFHIAKLLSELSEAPAIQNDALRSLVQTLLDPDNRPLFMEQVVWSKSSLSGFDVDNLCDNDEFQPERYSMYIPLMRENQKRTASISLSRAHSTSLHSGKLAKTEIKSWGVSRKIEIKTNANAKSNLHFFISVLLNVCMAIPSNGGEVGTKGQRQDKNSEVSVDAMRKVALLLVEIVSPDVMFNGLPWPEEEFSKESKSRNSPVQLEWTVRLLNIMKSGQLLPPPLCYVGHILHELKANEVLYLLRDIWGYMRMNVPVPALFIKDPSTKICIRNSDFLKVDPSFTEKLRLVLLNNVETLGHHYPKFFPVASIVPSGSKNNGAAVENGSLHANSTSSSSKSK